MPPLPTLKDVVGGRHGSGLPTLHEVVHGGGKLPTLSDVISGRHPVTVAAKPAEHHGSLLGNLAHDAESAVANIVPGTIAIAEHPVRAVKQMGHQYADYYGPLAHGDIGKFWQNVHDHPLQLGMDAFALATLGAGTAAKLGLLSSRAVDLTVPNIAKMAGQEGEDVVLRKSSTNPLIRSRQVAINRALNRARPDIPVVGSQARFARSVGRRALQPSQTLALKGKSFELAFARLSNEEKAAWHLKMQAIEPQAYIRLLHDGVVEDAAGTEAAMTKVLEGDKLNRLYKAPSKKLTNALVKGRALSELMATEKISRGTLDELSAAERPYLPQRLLHGAEYERPTPAKLGVDSPALRQARGYRDQLLRRLDAETTKPRTPAEAQAALSKLEREHNAALDKIGGGMFGDIKQSEVSFRTRENRRAARQNASHSGASGRMSTTRRTVSQEMRDEAEKRIEAAIRVNPTHPISVQWAARTGAIDQLRAALNPELFAKIDKSKLGRSIVAPTEHTVRLRGALAIADERIARLEQTVAGRVKDTGFIDQPGASIPELAQALAAKGEEQPAYVPHSAHSGKLPSRAWRPSSLNPPADLGSAKMNVGTLMEKGMLNIHHDSLSREHTLFARHVGRTDINQAIIEHAAREPATGLPAGYEYVKTVTGQRTETYTARAEGDLKEALTVPDEQTLRERYFTRNRDDPAIATDGEGHKLIVPTKVADHLSPAARPTAGLAQKILFSKPTSIWKHLVLGLRPIYFFNITLSQHILGLLQSAPKLHGVQAYLDHLIPGVRLGKLTDETIAEVMPEQAHGAFSSSEGYTSNKGLAAGAKAYQGVMPATLKVENWLRRLMIDGWAHSEPEIQAAMQANGGDINAAMRQVAKTDPHVIEEISARVDHAQGNYRTYSAPEQKLRTIVPFYGWDRHIVQSTYRLLAERPAVAAAGFAVGRAGEQKTLKDFGELPTYLQGIVRLGGLPGFMGSMDGRTPAVSTKALGPFEADAAIMRTIESLFHGQAGTSPEEAGNVNPFLVALVEQITGRNVATGSTLKDNLPFGFGNILPRAILGVPQARLLEEAANWHPLGKPKRPTSAADIQSQLSALLGPLAVKKIDVPSANRIAASQGQRP
jgi:hypothetical protein